MILKRDRFRCRACSASARLVVHHRSGVNRRRRLITLCIGCHTRVHRYRALRSWVPEVLLKLWRERHPREPVQLQLPFGIKRQVNRPATTQRKSPDPKGRGVLGPNYGTAPLRDPLQTGDGLDIESQPKATVSNWTQMLGARTKVEDKAAILAIGPEEQAQEAAAGVARRAPPVQRRFGSD